ncbi:NAD-dependent epimerase/dehydratase family protein [Azospirillum soli]|uniref:NAD-dependent epimerase/dehydratase family protein n=1 Tax=Azospirillum soli TaxID=1304799 RepID=UPI001AE2C522|nr:NAD-dependent epimerase/dehydratase family protein [Azospirillum soli]MBP2316241.1 nucleoside-diphosphate-sugar epimerase [Azospirillum soli]
MRKTKVLVCGATGFIGRNIAEALALRDDLDVHAVRFTRPEYECPGLTWHQADLRDASQVGELIAGVDVVVQAAATTSGSKDIVTRPYIHVTDNAVMNSLILRACYDHKVKHFVFFSCSVMYQSSETPWREDDWSIADELNSRYFGVGWTKIYIEKMCQFFSNLGVTKHTVIRHSNIYGPHDKFDLERSHVFGATVTKVMTNTSGTVTVWGTGEEARDLLYVDDLVRFIDLAITRQESPYELFHVGYGSAVTIKELVSRIIAASGRNLRVEHDLSQPTIKTSLALDSSRATELLGWERQVSLDEGIRRTIAWWNAAHGGRLAEPKTP